MTKMSMNALAAALAGSLLTVAAPALAAEAGHAEIARQPWSFSGVSGRYDKAQLQRGFQVYQVVCSSCHGLKRLSFRNLVQPGGPEFPEEAVKKLAKDWPNKITDGPNDAGEMFERDALLSDPIRGPFKNDKAARAAFGGALPPDLSVIAKARGVEYGGSWWYHWIHMAGDIAKAYQEGGADYLYALMTGYTEPPKDFKLGDGMSYNQAFPGHQISMPAPLGDGAVSYDKGADGKPVAPETMEQYARDISAFLSWAADPSLNERKDMGLKVLIYLLITTVLLYLGKRRLFASVH